VPFAPYLPAVPVARAGKKNRLGKKHWQRKFARI
jgi:hypothetical protein